MVRGISGGPIALILLVRVALAADTRFAIIGDYGTDNAPARAVANLVISNLQPAFVVTLGDNNYGTSADYDDAVGKYYARYIGNYSGAYGPGSTTNRFFPAIGNHDYYGDGYAAYTNYFILPGNERYYDVRRGPVHIFILNSDGHEPDGTLSTSTQAMWLSNRLAATDAPWRLVVTHHAPYSSSGSDASARWPYPQWGADVVLAGHSHNYERIEQGGFPYIVNGVGGASFAPIDSPMAGSRVHIDDKYGAMLAIANDAQITFEFYSAPDVLLRDRFTLQRPKLHIARDGANVDVGWSTNGTQFKLEATRRANWVDVTQAAAIRGTNNIVTLPLDGGREAFRLRRR
jgi:tartrate-resistant acid phosphatase type 5